MNVYFLPFLERGNPYQRELAQALSAEGVEIRGAESSPLLLLPELRAGGVHVLHLHWLWGITAGRSLPRASARLVLFLAQLALARAMGIGLVFTVHNLRPHESRHPRLDLFCTKSVLRLSHRVLVHAEAAREVLAARLRLSSRTLAKVITVAHGHYRDSYPNDRSEERARRELGIQPRDFVFSNVGMLRPYKGILELVEAFRKLEGEEVKLVIAGRPLDDAFQAEIERCIADDPRILFFPGFVPEEEVQTFVKAADVMVFPFEDVLSSGSVILGLSFGRTCVAPRRGCIRDIVEEADGYLYDPGPGELAGALQRVLGDRDRAREKGARASARALAWGWPDAARATAAVYREVRGIK